MYDGARTQNTILVFGPQALAFNQDSIRSLGANTADPSVLEWVKDVVAELPDRFTEISERIPELGIIPGASLLRSLYQQLKTGSSEAITNDPNIPNILLTPLCVITHLVEFTRKVGLRKSGSGFEAWKDEKNNLSDATHAVGLCTGLLAALVVSLSRGLGDIEKYGAIAVRLAMVIGAVVDAEDALNTHSASFSAAWRSCDGFSAMEEIIRKFENVCGRPLNMIEALNIC